MSKSKLATYRLQWICSALLASGSALGLAAVTAASTGCKQESSVSKQSPAEDAVMEKVTINVFGMT